MIAERTYYSRLGIHGKPPVCEMHLGGLSNLDVLPCFPETIKSTCWSELGLNLILHEFVTRNNDRVLPARNAAPMTCIDVEDLAAKIHSRSVKSFELPVIVVIECGHLGWSGASAAVSSLTTCNCTGVILAVTILDHNRSLPLVEHIDRLDYYYYSK